MPNAAVGAGQADISQTGSASFRTSVKDAVTRAGPCLGNHDAEAGAGPLCRAYLRPARRERAQGADYSPVGRHRPAVTRMVSGTGRGRRARGVPQRAGHSALA